MISSYQAAQEHMSRARNKDKGRPMKGEGWRLFEDGDQYVVKLYDREVGRFHPDNTFVFSLSGIAAYPVAQSLSATMHRNLPFRWVRFAKAKYRVEHTNNIPVTHWYAHFNKPTNAPEVYIGLSFDLFTGKCLNYKPDYKPKIDPVRRKAWLAASKAWKRKLKTMARLGVFDTLIAAEAADRTPYSQRANWGHDYHLDILYNAIKDGDCNTDLLRMLVASMYTPWGPLSSDDVYERIEKLVASHSTELRKRFGVFKGE